MADRIDQPRAGTNFYASKWDKPYLTPSLAVTLLTKSPMHAKLQCPFYGEVDDVRSQAMAEGQIVDTLVLGGKPNIKVFTLSAFLTKEAKKRRDAAISSGLMPMKMKDYNRCADAAKAVRDSVGTIDDDVVGKIFKAGIIKRRLFWESDGVYCSTEPDVHLPDDGVVLDLKRTKCVPSQMGWQRHCDSRNYHIQCAAVLEATGAKDFGWIVVEATPPYGAVVHWASDAFIERGIREWNSAKFIWNTCITNGVFPGYQGGVIDPMPWRLLGDDDPEATNIVFTEA